MTLRGNDFADSTVAIRNEVPEYLGGTAKQLDGRLNYFGPTGPSMDSSSEEDTDAPQIVGDVIAKPFLPTPATATENLPETSFATSLKLEPGTQYAVGVPGPASGSVDDVFSDFQGVIYGFDAETQSWTQLTANDPVQPLSAMLVIPETETTAVVSFDVESSTPTAPEQTELEDGWNFVSAPTYGDVDDAFGISSGDISMVMQPYTGPAGQPGPASTVNGSYTLGSQESGPTASAFTSYFVFAESSGKLPARVTENPSMDEYYTKLGLDDPAVGGSADPLSPAVRSHVNRVIKTAGEAAPANNRSAAQVAVRTELATVLENTSGNKVQVLTEVEASVVDALVTKSFTTDEEVQTAVTEAIEDAVTVEPTTETNSTATAHVSAAV